MWSKNSICLRSRLESEAQTWEKESRPKGERDGLFQSSDTELILMGQRHWFRKVTPINRLAAIRNKEVVALAIVVVVTLQFAILGKAGTQ